MQVLYNQQLFCMMFRLLTFIYMQDLVVFIINSSNKKIKTGLHIS